MIPVLFAISVMVWMWAAAMRHAVSSLARTASPSQQRVYLLMVVAGGAAVLVALVAKVMPVSLLSAGWSQERLADLVRNAVVIAAVVAGAAVWRAHYLLPGSLSPSRRRRYQKRARKRKGASRRLFLFRAAFLFRAPWHRPVAACQ